MLKSIEEHWLRFIEVVCPSLSPNDAQYAEARRVFFAGAVCIYKDFKKMGDVGVAECSQYLDNRDEEIQQFHEEIKLEARRQRELN